MDYDLKTFDQWMPGSPSNSDVFYLSIGANPFTSIGSLGSVSCASAPAYSDSLYSGKVWWWGNDTISCSGTCNQNSTVEPCHMTGSRIFDYKLDDAAPILRVGLNTGFCIWSFGTFDIKILPTKIDYIDPIGSFVTNGSVSNNPQGLGTSTQTCVGLIADGATQIVLRHEVLGPGQVEFQVDDTDGGPSTADDVGFLSSLGGQETQTSLSVDAVQLNDGRYMAFAVYHAPADFVTATQYKTQGCRRVRCRAEFQPEEEERVEGSTMTEQYIPVKRPPVVLLHGLWSDASTWGLTLTTQNFITDPNFVVQLGDYHQTNASWFSTNSSVTQFSIIAAIIRLRNQNYAATRADVVGHSMGGVLARLYVQSFSGVPYLRNENFNQGDIHKLITIDSPLKGSGLATFLMRSPKLRFEFSIFGWNCNAGAVSDLDPTRTPAASNAIVQSNLIVTNVYAHAIVGTGGPHALAFPSTAGKDAWLARAINHLGAASYLTETHDLIVDTFSQDGNIANTSPFGFLSSTQPATHDTIHHDARVKTEVLDLLNTNILTTTSFTPTIPTRSINTTPPVIPDPPEVDGLEMISPDANSSYSSGSEIPVVVAPMNGFKPTRILVICPFGAEEIDPEFLTTTMSVPDSAVGLVTFYASAFDADGNFAGTEEVPVLIAPRAELTGISVEPTDIELTRIGPETAVRITGHYDDEVDRDLTNSALGTTYESSDTDVATVSSEGIITSVGFGSCTVTATNGMFSDNATVDVTGLPCPGDITWDNTVDINDLTAVILAWGNCYACGADINQDGVVDINDMTAVILGWGACPAP
ncbi:MAG TPA: Ig-like domain-containing protein [Phycisphaerales bacterium]|nr:Ig-like domain-containing protein [Phycisphaerales bacterium]